jgi:hypothetical protein
MSWIQDMATAAPIDAGMPGDSDVAVLHFHVPRTGGDSLRTHLFPVTPDAEWRGGPPGQPWWTDEDPRHE